MYCMNILLVCLGGDIARSCLASRQTLDVLVQMFCRRHQKTYCDSIKCGSLADMDFFASCCIPFWWGVVCDQPSQLMGRYCRLARC